MARRFDWTAGLHTGARMASACAVVMAMSSMKHNGNPFGGWNAMATALGIGGTKPREGFEPKQTLGGLALLTGGLLVFGVGYEATLALLGRRSSRGTGIAGAAAAYALDRVLLPPWLLPNFKATMGVTGTFAKYAAIARAAQ